MKVWVLIDNTTAVFDDSPSPREVGVYTSETDAVLKLQDLNWKHYLGKHEGGAQLFLVAVDGNSWTRDARDAEDEAEDRRIHEENMKKLWEGKP